MRIRLHCYEVVNELLHLHDDRCRYIRLFNKPIANIVQCYVVFIICRVIKTGKPSSAFVYCEVALLL